MLREGTRTYRPSNRPGTISRREDAVIKVIHVQEGDSGALAIALFWGPRGGRTHNLNYILKSSRITTTAPLNSKRQRQNAVWDQEHEHDGDDWFARRKRWEVRQHPNSTPSLLGPMGTEEEHASPARPMGTSPGNRPTNHGPSEP